MCLRGLLCPQRVSNRPGTRTHWPAVSSCLFIISCFLFISYLYGRVLKGDLKCPTGRKASFKYVLLVFLTTSYVCCVLIILSPLLPKLLTGPFSLLISCGFISLKNDFPLCCPYTHSRVCDWKTLSQEDTVLGYFQDT